MLETYKMKAVMKRTIFFILTVLQLAIFNKLNAQVLVLSDPNSIIIDNSDINTKSTRIVSSSDKYPNGQLLRHTLFPKISLKFQLSPNDVNSAGKEETAATMNWAVGMGYNIEENERSDVMLSPTFAEPKTGCAAYKGPNSSDSEGSWRVPSHGELMIIILLNDKLNSSKLSGVYFSSTEVLISNTNQGAGIVYSTKEVSNAYKNSSKRFRCIKDLP